MEIDRKTLALPHSEYFSVVHRKNQIVLHFTAGDSCESARNWWVTDDRPVATAYGVDPSGKIYELFNPKYWSYHIGAGSELEKASIGIEIANWGPLRRRGDWMCSWPRSWGHRFCDFTDTDKYVTADYRGEQYFAAFPDEQVAAVAALVSHLCERFDIPHVVSTASRMGVFDLNAMKTFRGITTHTTYRQDKTDVGPAFPWKLIKDETEDAPDNSTN